MQLLPIPIDRIEELYPLWSPFLPHIAKRSKDPITDLHALVNRREVQPILAWDEHEHKAVGLAGIRYILRGQDRIAQWCWMTGSNMKAWTHLLPELERYLSEHENCVEVQPVCRPGWSRILAKNGYKITHYTMHKTLGAGHGQR